MIILSSLSEYLVLLGSMLLMIGLARIAYGDFQGSCRVRVSRCL